MNQAIDSPERFHSTEDLKQYSYYNLCVHLKAGHDLAAKDSCGTSDPYVKFLINSKIVYKSKTVYKDLNPFWDEKFEVMIEDISVPMDIKVNDEAYVVTLGFKDQIFFWFKSHFFVLTKQPESTWIVFLHAQTLGQAIMNVWRPYSIFFKKLHQNKYNLN